MSESGLDGFEHDVDWRRLEEDLAVARWRTEQLLALGFGLRDAAFLAIAHVDIHELERLIANGCPRETAVRIAV
jgi:hypothetical protein